VINCRTFGNDRNNKKSDDRLPILVVALLNRSSNHCLDSPNNSVAGLEYLAPWLAILAKLSSQTCLFDSLQPIQSMPANRYPYLWISLSN